VWPLRTKCRSDKVRVEGEATSFNIEVEYTVEPGWTTRQVVCVCLGFFTVGFMFGGFVFAR
jgi:hypothetical protein